MLITDLKPEHIAEYFQNSASWGYYTDRRGVLPSTYLDYSRDDIAESQTPRSLINAVGNAKRAFHLQVERLCDAFAWKTQGGRRNASFGTRLDYLGKCGVVSPNILRKLNATRNKVEHDYLAPTAEQVEGYVDIVELFLMATKTLLDQFPNCIYYELMKDDDYDSSLELPEEVIVEIKMVEGGITLASGGATKSLAQSDAEYFPWLSALVRHIML